MFKKKMQHEIATWWVHHTGKSSPTNNNTNNSNNTDNNTPNNTNTTTLLHRDGRDVMDVSTLSEGENYILLMTLDNDNDDNDGNNNEKQQHNNNRSISIVKNISELTSLTGEKNEEKNDGKKIAILCIDLDLSNGCGCVAVKDIRAMEEERRAGVGEDEEVGGGRSTNNNMMEFFIARRRSSSQQQQPQPNEEKKKKKAKDDNKMSTVGSNNDSTTSGYGTDDEKDDEINNNAEEEGRADVGVRFELDQEVPPREEVDVDNDNERNNLLLYHHHPEEEPLPRRQLRVLNDGDRIIMRYKSGEGEEQEQQVVSCMKMEYLHGHNHHHQHHHHHCNNSNMTNKPMSTVQFAATANNKGDGVGGEKEEEEEEEPRIQSKKATNIDSFQMNSTSAAAEASSAFIRGDAAIMDNNSAKKGKKNANAKGEEESMEQEESDSYLSGEVEMKDQDQDYISAITGEDGGGSGQDASGDCSNKQQQRGDGRGVSEGDGKVPLSQHNCKDANDIGNDEEAASSPKGKDKEEETGLKDDSDHSKPNSDSGGKPNENDGNVDGLEIEEIEPNNEESQESQPFLTAQLEQSSDEALDDEKTNSDDEEQCSDDEELLSQPPTAPNVDFEEPKKNESDNDSGTYDIDPTQVLTLPLSVTNKQDSMQSFSTTTTTADEENKDDDDSTKCPEQKEEEDENLTAIEDDINAEEAPPVTVTLPSKFSNELGETKIGKGSKSDDDDSTKCDEDDKKTTAKLGNELGETVNGSKSDDDDSTKFDVEEDKTSAKFSNKFGETVNGDKSDDDDSTVYDVEEDKTPVGNELGEPGKGDNSDDDDSTVCDVEEDKTPAIDNTTVDAASNNLETAKGNKSDDDDSTVCPSEQDKADAVIVNTDKLESTAKGEDKSDDDSTTLSERNDQDEKTDVAAQESIGSKNALDSVKGTEIDNNNTLEDKESAQNSPSIKPADDEAASSQADDANLAGNCNGPEIKTNELAENIKQYESEDESCDTVVGDGPTQNFPWGDQKIMPDHIHSGHQQDDEYQVETQDGRYFVETQPDEPQPVEPQPVETQPFANPDTYSPNKSHYSGKDESAPNESVDGEEVKINGSPQADEEKISAKEPSTLQNNPANTQETSPAQSEKEEDNEAEVAEPQTEDNNTETKEPEEDSSEKPSQKETEEAGNPANTQETSPAQSEKEEDNEAEVAEPQTEDNNTETKEPEEDSSEKPSQKETEEAGNPANTQETSTAQSEKEEANGAEVAEPQTEDNSTETKEPEEDSSEMPSQEEETTQPINSLVSIALQADDVNPPDPDQGAPSEDEMTVAQEEPQKGSPEAVVPSTSSSRPKRKRAQEEPNGGDEPIPTPSSRSKKRMRGVPSSGGKSNTVRVMFTGINPTRKHKQMIETIGAQLVDSIEDASTATHVIASDGKTKLRRTPKLMICFSATPNILTLSWLEASSKEQKVLDADDFLLTDKEAEKRYEFSMKETIENGRKARLDRGGVLGDKSVYICSGVAGNKAPSMKELQLIIQAAGGTVLKTLTNSNPLKTIVLTSDPSTKTQLKERGVPKAEGAGAKIMTTTQLFHTVTTQHLDDEGEEKSTEPVPAKRAAKRKTTDPPPTSSKRKSSRKR